MREEIKKLIGQKVDLFDKSGGLCNVRGIYQTNWWDVPEMKIIGAGKKAFEVIDSKGERAHHRYNKIAEVYNTEITFL